MRFIRRGQFSVWCLALFFLSFSSRGGAGELAFAPGPADNPLKGFVPYSGRNTNFPHSLEFNYISWRSLAPDASRFDWQPLEKLLDDAASRGHQTVFRVYLEYPGKPVAIPQYLLDAGVKIHAWTNTNTQPFPPRLDHTPDYEDPRLRSALTNFIHALGRRYDGDPRIGFITLGLLGTWGEWHNHPHSEWFASKTVQNEVMDAYEAAFKSTQLAARYPAGPGDPVYAPNFNRAIGYHDDSFAWATRPTGRREDGWFFLTRLAGAGAAQKWRERVVGGEVRPEVWKTLWDETSGAPKGQEYLPCVCETHASWLMNSGVFQRRLPEDKYKRALEGARSLGYEFWAQRAEISLLGDSMTISATVTNTGVAPFYYPWPVELGLAQDGKLAHVWKVDWNFTRVMPGETSVYFHHSRKIEHPMPPAGDFEILMRIVNPLTNGVSLRFANRSQDATLPGWLTLGSFKNPSK